MQVCEKIPELIPGNETLAVLTTIGKYTLIYRKTDYKPWVVAYNFDEKSNTWGNGHYFEDIRDAILYIMNIEDPARIIDCSVEICKSRDWCQDLFEVQESLRELSVGLKKEMEESA